MPTAFEEIILGLIQQLVGEQQQEQLAATLQTILNAVNAALVLLRQIVGDLVDPVTGLAAIEARLATFQATQAIDNTAILTAIAATQQTGSPVTLPASYPGTWSATIASDSATGVWNEPDVVTGANALGDLSNIAVVVSNKGTNQLQPALGGRPFAWQGNVFQTSPFPLVLSLPPDIPIGLASPGTDLVTFLNAQNPGWTWGWDDADNTWASATDPLDFGVTWFCTMSAQQFDSLVNGFAAATALPPIWPGLASVTLGSPVALSDGLVVTGPLDGVIVAITSVPAPISFYPFGTIKSYVRGGAIVFTDDNGDSEFPQPFGPDNQLILPKSMHEAASATVRLPSGIVGTITPFTVA